MIQLISLRFNYKRKRPSYPSALDRGSTFLNKLPLSSQESLNYSFYFAFIPLFLPLLPPVPLAPSLSPAFVFLIQDCEALAIMHINSFGPKTFNQHTMS